MASSDDHRIDPVERFHQYLTQPEITREDLETLFLIEQEIRELKLHYRDNRIYIEGFIHDELARMQNPSMKTGEPVCSLEFVESLKFVER